MSRSARAKDAPAGRSASADPAETPGVSGSAGSRRAAGQPGTEPCLHCGHPVAVRLMGCKGGHCPNCRHPYPHGDCSD